MDGMDDAVGEIEEEEDTVSFASNVELETESTIYELLKDGADEEAGTDVGDTTGRDEALLRKVGDGDVMIVLLVTFVSSDVGVVKLLVFVDISGDWIVVATVV